MKIRPKSPEQLQSQVAAYAESKRERFNMSSADEVYRKIGTHVVHGSMAVIEDDGYIDFLRARRQSERTATEHEVAILNRFPEFFSGLRSDHTQIGNGFRSVVYKITINGSDYAVRDVRPSYDHESVERIVHDHVAASVVGQAIPGLERVVAASYEKGVVISEFVPGKHMSAMSAYEVAAIPDEHITALLHHRIEASKEGILFDATTENTLYDPLNGFTDIDYSKGGHELDETAAMSGLFSSLSVAGDELLDKNRERQAEVMATINAVHARVAKYICDHYEGEARDMLLNRYVVVNANLIASATDARFQSMKRATR